MRTLHIVIIAAALLFVGSSCGKKSDDKKSDDQGATKPDPSTDKKTPAGVDKKTPDTLPEAKAEGEGEGEGEDELPTAEDFEEEAATEITEENLEAELAKLEQAFADEAE